MNTIIQFKKETWVAGIFSLYVVFSFVLRISGFGLYDTKRILQLAVLTIFYLGWWLVYDKSTIKIPKNKWILFLNLFFLVGLISASISLYPGSAWLEVLYLFLLFLTVILVGNFIDYKDLGKLIIISCFLYVCLYLLLFVGNYISAHISPFVPLWPGRLSFNLISGDGRELTREVVYFANKRFFNHTQTATLPILIAILSYSPVKKTWSTLLFVLTAFWWCLVIASGARGTTLALICVTIFLLIKDYKSGKEFIKYVFFTAIVGLVIYFFLYVLFNPSEVSSSSLMRISDQGRFTRWAEALALLKDNPIFGIGPYHFSIAGTSVPAHPHNFYLQILLEWGIIAFSLLGISGLVFVRWIFLGIDVKRHGEKNTSPIFKIGFISALVAIMVHSFFSGNFHTPLSQIWILLLFSWVFSYWQDKASPDSLILLRLKIFKTILIGAIGVLAFLIHDDVNHLEASREKYLIRQEELVKGKKFRPRFWEQGFIYESLDEDTYTE